jgi:pimeloyl-ACP methyl ester carboxylesterase
MKSMLEAESYGGNGAVAIMKPIRRPAWLTEREWPFETQRLEVEGAGIAVTDAGQGPVLVFMHTGLWSFIWRDVITRLRGDFRCVAFDAPGTGQSDCLPPSEIGLERASRAAAAVIEALDLRDLTLVVHDLGGPAGIAGAGRTPERVRGLAAVNTFAWRPSGAIFRGMLALMGSTPMRQFDVFSQLLGWISASSFGAGRHLDSPSRGVFRAGLGRRGLATFHRYLRDARHCDSVYQRAGAALAGPFRTLPLLTIFGERNDPFRFQRRWKQMYPDARQVVVAKGNHFPMCDDPDRVAATLKSWHRERVAPAWR